MYWFDRDWLECREVADNLTSEEFGLVYNDSGSPPFPGDSLPRLAMLVMLEFVPSSEWTLRN